MRRSFWCIICAKMLITKIAVDQWSTITQKIKIAILIFHSVQHIWPLLREGRFCLSLIKQKPECFKATYCIQYCSFNTRTNHNNKNIFADAIASLVAAEANSQFRLGTDACIITSSSMSLCTLLDSSMNSPVVTETLMLK